MAGDVVERLRKPWEHTDGKREILCAEAATEITALRARLAELEAGHAGGGVVALLSAAKEFLVATQERVNASFVESAYDPTDWRRTERDLISAIEAAALAPSPSAGEEPKETIARLPQELGCENDAATVFRSALKLATPPATPVQPTASVEAVAELGLSALPEDVQLRMEREARNFSNLWANGDKPVYHAALALQLRTHLAALTPAPTQGDGDQDILWARFVPDWGSMQLCRSGDFGAVEFRRATPSPAPVSTPATDGEVAKTKAPNKADGVEMRMSVEELRRGIRRAWDEHYELLDALRDAPALPHRRVLRTLASAAKWPADHAAGKAMQRDVGIDLIPPVSECEGGAGFWQRIWPALSNRAPGHGEAVPVAWRDISTAPKDGTWFVAEQDGETFPCEWHVEEDGEGGRREGWFDHFNQSFEEPTRWAPVATGEKPAPATGKE